MASYPKIILIYTLFEYSTDYTTKHAMDLSCRRLFKNKNKKNQLPSTSDFGICLVGASLDNVTRFVDSAINNRPSLTHAKERAAVQPAERTIATVIIDGRCIGLLQSHLERSTLPVVGIGPERASINQRLNLECDALVDIECLARSPVISLESEDGLLSKVIKVDREGTVDSLFIRTGDLIGLGKSVL